MNREITFIICCAGFSATMAAAHPDNPRYKLWVTRDTLSKYWLMGKRGYTEYDAK